MSSNRNRDPQPNIEGFSKILHFSKLRLFDLMTNHSESEVFYSQDGISSLFWQQVSQMSTLPLIK